MSADLNVTIQVEGTGLPSGGKAGQVPMLIDGKIVWTDLPSGLPSDGSTGDVLAKTEDGAAWKTPTGADDALAWLIAEGLIVPALAVGNTIYTDKDGAIIVL